ncbi:trypsin-like [Convolutriloba macropyga]|uniref:trypsin-like n=1 Tax=Convolutriloba macropyga TaxID=536237 RepID=UPI003F524385
MLKLATLLHTFLATWCVSLGPCWSEDAYYSGNTLQGHGESNLSHKRDPDCWFNYDEAPTDHNITSIVNTGGNFTPLSMTCYRNRGVGAGGRIINGMEANIEDHPWIVYIEMCEINDPDDCSLCGGTILSYKTVLTAKHCVRDPCNGFIRYGDINNNKGRQFQFKCQSSNVIRHPNNDVDLAVIRLDKGKKFLKSNLPLSIPRSADEQPPPGTIVYVVGWGRACKEAGSCYDQSVHPDNLQMVRIKVVDGIDCVYKETRFCAGGVDSRGLPKDACQGDSGGPMECEDQNSTIYICGVVSIGPRAPDCGRKPGGYVKLAVPDIIEWLINEGGAQNSKRIATRARTRSGKTQFGRKIQPHKAITIAAVTAMLSLICWLRN